MMWARSESQLGVCERASKASPKGALTLVFLDASAQQPGRRARTPAPPADRWARRSLTARRAVIAAATLHGKDEEGRACGGLILDGWT